MEFVAVILVAVFVILVVSYPLFGRQRRLHEMEDMFDLGDTRQLDFLNSKRSAIANNIRELEFEHQMGKLSEQDYEMARRDYETENKKIDAAIEKLQIRKEIEELIEDEVQSRRRIQ
ncbi:MAG: hypothetical protein JSW50_05055 [Candidatus Latescibacterota bacterium]|nr:MAG: hypothetical protein JSW50_05055 [Candidatus Latescibacterota bacterium]